jgi:hypothetical protein
MRTPKYFLMLGMALIIAAGCDNLPGTGGWSDATGPGSGGTGPGTLTVFNRGTQRMTSVYIASCSASSWGSNKLGSSFSYIFENGGYETFSVEPDCYDVMGKWGTVSSQSTRVIVKPGQHVSVNLVP